MISRKSTMAIAGAYAVRFRSLPTYQYSRTEEPPLDREKLYDFLYERNYEAWFCNIAKYLSGFKQLKEFILGLHTGESIERTTPNWSWDERKKLGQFYLKNLAQDFMVWFHEGEEKRHSSIKSSAIGTVLAGFERSYTNKISSEFCRDVHDEMARRLEIDGYVFRDNELYQSESEVLNVEEETGLLQKLYSILGLSDQQITFQFLKLSEEHYIASRWSDCIGNARKFFEVILRQVACRHSTSKGITISSTTIESPKAIRDYLEKEELIEKRERETIDKIYALLSHTGGHPYMAEKDQARLLRQICLVVTQFVMLRLEGYLKKL